VEENEDMIGTVFIPFSKGKNKNKATLVVDVSKETFLYHIIRKEKTKKAIKDKKVEKEIISDAFIHLVSDTKLKNEIDKEILTYFQKNEREVIKTRELLHVRVCQWFCTDYNYAFGPGGFGDYCNEAEYRCTTYSFPVERDYFDNYDQDWENGGGSNGGNGPSAEEQELQEFEMKQISKELGFTAGSPDWEYFERNHLLRKIAQGYLVGNNSIEDLYLAAEASVVDPALIAQFSINYANLKFLKSQGITPYANWSTFELWWEAAKSVAPTSEDIHTGLDVIGLLPVIGEAADFANALFYVFEGDGVNASISIASTVPFLGTTASGSRLVVKTVKYGNNKVTQAVFKNNNIIYFAKTAAEDTYEIARSTFRKVMQTPSGFIAHHVITHKFRQWPIVQKAAKSGKFHINDVINGFNIDQALHTGYSTAHRT
jgi:hypothetical protein